jgi:D-inositol-3-phosphate glycosyltransferase
LNSPVQRVAIISLHTSPLAQPGAGDSGGMNVYVRELVSSLSQSGIDCVTYTRADREGLAAEVSVEPGHRVVHIEAGPHHLPKEALGDVIEEFTEGVLAHLRAIGGADLVHANYWLSGMVGHRIKHALDIPFVMTFHTMARVKAEMGDPEPISRDLAEAQIVACSDAICVSCEEEEQLFRNHYGDPPGRVEIIAPGVEHALFAPGDQRGARDALGIDNEIPVLVFVGRIQPLKGPDVAVRALHRVAQTEAGRKAVLYIVGGASGSEGDAEVALLDGLVAELGLSDHVVFVPPQPHHILSTYYRAADVVVVPSRSESFGLVALEAAACGVPVVASAVGGLLSLVDDQVTGVLVSDRRPEHFAAAILSILENPERAAAMSQAAATRAGGYTWGFAASRLRRLYLGLTESEDRHANLVVCA